MPFDDEVIGSGGGSDADVDLPGWRDVEVGDREELLLLIMQGVNGSEAAVVLKVATHLTVEVVADLGAGATSESKVHIRSMLDALKRGLTAKYQRLIVLLRMGRISHVQASGE